MSEKYFVDPEIFDDRESIQSNLEGYISNSENDPMSTHFLPGVGKSYGTLELISNDWQKVKNYKRIGSQWVIAIPKHDMVEGANNMVEFFQNNGIPHAHIKGKVHFCTEPPGHTWEDETCANCPLRETDCQYYQQDWGSYVAIVPFEMIRIIPRMDGPVEVDGEMKGKYRRLIYDEMPFRNWMEEITVPDGFEWTVNITNRKIETIGEKEYIFADMGINCKFSVKDLSALRLFSPSGVTEYRFYQFLRRHEEDRIYGHYWNGRWTLFTFKTNMYPRSYQKCIINCATTPDTIRLKMFGSDLKIINGESAIKNSHVFIGPSWCKATSKKYAEDFITFVKQFDGDKFIACKKDDEIEGKIKAALPNVDIVHYGEIGTNKYNKEYAAGFIYGGFHYDPLTRFKLKYKLTNDEIKAMEDSVVEQAFHRCRPLLHEYTPLFIMSNHGIRKQFSDKPIIFPLRILDIHGTYGIKDVDKITAAWGDSIGISRTLRSQYKQFLLYTRRFLEGYVWTSVDDFLFCIDQGMSDEEIAEFCDKSIKTVKRWKKKDYNKWRRSINLNTLIEDGKL